MRVSVIFKVLIDTPPSPLFSIEDRPDPVLVLELCLWPARWPQEAGQKLADMLEAALRDRGAEPWEHQHTRTVRHFSGDLEWDLHTISVTLDPAFDEASATELLGALLQGTLDYRPQRPALPSRDVVELAQHYVANRFLLFPDDQQIKSFKKDADANLVIRLRDKESGDNFLALYAPDIAAHAFSRIAGN